MDKEKLKKTTEDVVDKSVEALGKAGNATKKFCKKLGLRANNVKSDVKIKDLYKKIGNTVYDKIKEGSSTISAEDFTDIIAQIDALKSSIDTNNAAINEK